MHRGHRRNGRFGLCTRSMTCQSRGAGDYRIARILKAQATAERLTADCKTDVRAATNVEAAAQGDIVILAVRFASQDSALGDISPHVAGKIVVDTTVPLVPPKVMRVQLPLEGRAAVHAQKNTR